MTEVKAWGAAFHGLVRNGSLTLPNAAEMAYPQPDNGDVHRIAFAGTPDINLTNDEKANLLVEGKVFYKYALLTGGHIYGEDVSADFIYQSPNGKRWAVDTSGLGFSGGSMSNALEGNVVFTRFGDFVKTAEPETLTPEVYLVAVSLADVQQSTPVITSASATETLDIAQVEFESAKSDGSECMLSIRAYFTTATPESTYGNAPTGFVKLAISGDEGAFIVAPSVYRSRAQTLGTFVDTNTDTLSSQLWYWEPGDQEWQTTGTGEQTQVEATSGTQNIDQSVTDRLLALQYNDTDALVELKLTASYQESRSTPTASAAAEVLSINTTASSSATCTLLFGANSIVMSGTGSTSESASFDQSSGITFSNSWTRSTTINGDTVGEVDSSFDSSPSPPYKLAGAASPLTMNGFDYQGLFTHLFEINTRSDPANYKNIEFEIKRWTKQVYGLAIKEIFFSPGPVESFFVLDALSPISVSRGNHSIPSENSNPYAAHHPVTGEIEWNSSEPVAYV